MLEGPSRLCQTYTRHQSCSSGSPTGSYCTAETWNPGRHCSPRMEAGHGQAEQGQAAGWAPATTAAVVEVPAAAAAAPTAAAKLVTLTAELAQVAAGVEPALAVAKQLAEVKAQLAALRVEAVRLEAEVVAEAAAARWDRQAPGPTYTGAKRV